METGRKSYKSRWGLLPIYMAVFRCDGQLVAGGATTLAKFSAGPMGRKVNGSVWERTTNLSSRTSWDGRRRDGGLASREGKFLSNSGRGEVCWWKVDFNVCWIKGGPIAYRAVRAMQSERKNEEDGSSQLAYAGPTCRRRHTKGTTHTLKHFLWPARAGSKDSLL